MGIDAIMNFRLNDGHFELSDADKNKIGLYLLELFPDAIYSNKENRIHAVRKIGFDQFGSYADYSVSLWGRFYCEGYERGDILTYINIAEAIEYYFLRNYSKEKIKVDIYYYGDNSDERVKFSYHERDRLKTYYFNNRGHHNYYAGFSSRTYKNCICEWCGGTFMARGGGTSTTHGSYSFVECSGCREKRIVSNNSGDVIKTLESHEDFLSWNDTEAE